MINMVELAEQLTLQGKAIVKLPRKIPSYLVCCPKVIQEIWIRGGKKFTEEPHPYKKIKSAYSESGMSILNLPSEQIIKQISDTKLSNRITESFDLISFESQDVYSTIAKHVARDIIYFMYDYDIPKEDLKDLTEVASRYEVKLSDMMRADAKRDEDMKDLWDNLKSHLMKIFSSRVSKNPELDTLHEKVRLPGAMIRTFFNSFAGLATSIEWMILHLGQHPGWQSKVLGPSNAATTCFIQEVLRLYPTAWMMTRECVEEHTIGDTTFMPGDTVHVCMTALHTDKKYWEKPMIFDPKRFESSKHGGAEPFCFIPFGVGRHLCPANNFAMRYMTTYLKVFVSKYKVNSSNLNTVEAKPLIALRPTPNGLAKLSAL